MPLSPDAENQENQENVEKQENFEQPAAQNANTGDDEDQSGMWEETFKSHTDSKPNGLLS